MSERIRAGKITKKTSKYPNNGFFKKTLVQSAVSLVICIIMLISVKLSGEEGGFNALVKRYLYESTDIKQAAVSVFNKVNNIIDDEIIPVINNIGVADD